ncbi:MAG: hypothetical protein C0444_09250 [Microbacterium sp.]|nr:hypothetical protein [Microbacterium sp.]MBA4346323.1 hypothetical protein [Microbacterium sp.]
MRRSSRILSAAALTGVLSLVAAPALANGSGQTVDSPPWTWYIAAGGGEWGVSETSYNSDPISVTDAWQRSEFIVLAPTFVEDASVELEPATAATFAIVDCVSTTLTVDGSDSVVSCDNSFTTSWGLEITSDVRVLAPGDLARATYFVTNTTSEPLVFGYKYRWEYGDTNGHVRSSQPTIVQDSGGANLGFLDSPDVWSYNIGDGTVTAGVAWGIEGQPFAAADSSHNGFTEAQAELLPSASSTIAAGETIAIAFFHKVQQPDLLAFASTAADATDPAAMPVPQPAASSLIETPAQFMAEFASFSGRLTRGLPAGVAVGNWQPAAGPELAATGAGIDENLLMGGLAAALLGAGAALLIGRRRATVSAQR